MSTRATTLGALRKTPWAQPPLLGRSVRDELRSNLIAHLRGPNGRFPGLVGFDDTVLPQVYNAILSRQHFILLGTRGQAKSRLLRSLGIFLDEVVPMVAGSELRDDPFNPISREAIDLVARLGDETPIDWLGRNDRYVEKLATPDVTIADMIGDVDPIKAARGGHTLGHELTMHFGLLPRSNRGIFTINELPDLAGKIQVGLFNIMQEGDVQIKGYPIRLPLDVMLAFTANPEDYTARGKIITPLKDRIGSEIRTHYPRTLEEGMRITGDEAWTTRAGTESVDVPPFIAELVEQVAFQARDDKRVDRRSGVSQRLPISLMELVVSNVERRAIGTGEQAPVARVSDVYAGLPAITGKIELEYEGELQGGDAIAREMIRAAAASVFASRAGDLDVEGVVEWFEQGSALKIGVDDSTEACWQGFALVPGLMELVEEAGMSEREDHPRTVAACELVLEALAATNRISRSEDQGWSRPRPKRRRGPAPGDTFGL
ncbi:MAG: magnesium chelatase [Gemmatimonadales bacterium]|nr:magnesium chelatase [Gemmatimonadales bacterium]